jgi:dihydrofolate synthase/folylpolyglutamate synthase
VILDVAHNPQAAHALAENLATTGFAPETYAVCGMLKDKDIAGVLREMAPRVTRWHLATLAGPRGATADELAAQLKKTSLRKFESPAAALAAALGSASENDKIVVFGSFLTVGEAIAWLKHKTSRR